MSGKKYVAFLRSYYDALQELPQKSRAELALAIVEYGFTGKLPNNISVLAKAVFAAIRPTLDTSNAKADAANARWEKQNANKSMQGTFLHDAKPMQNTVVHDAKPMQNTVVHDATISYIREGEGEGEGEGNIDSKKRASRFTQPTLEEVQAYCVERGNGVDPQRFVDYYSSNGWKVGKNPMKDWKAAVRTWERNNGTTVTKPKQTGSYLDILERMERGESVDAEGNKPNPYLLGNAVSGFNTEPD